MQAYYLVNPFDDTIYADLSYILAIVVNGKNLDLVYSHDSSYFSKKLSVETWKFDNCQQAFEFYHKEVRELLNACPDFIDMNKVNGFSCGKLLAFNFNIKSYELKKLEKSISLKVGGAGYRLDFADEGACVKSMGALIEASLADAGIAIFEDEGFYPEIIFDNVMPDMTSVAIH